MWACCGSQTVKKEAYLEKWMGLHEKPTTCSRTSTAAFAKQTRTHVRFLSLSLKSKNGMEVSAMVHVTINPSFMQLFVFFNIVLEKFNVNCWKYFNMCLLIRQTMIPSSFPAAWWSAMDASHLTCGKWASCSSVLFCLGHSDLHWHWGGTTPH